MTAEPAEPDVVLIVDDDATNLGVLVNQLRDEGFETAVARNGKSAVDRARRLLPSAILLDVMMPDMNGFECCRIIKSNPALADIPILFMTALDSLDDKLEGFSAGGVDYITKPFQLEEVIVRVRTHCLVSRLRRELQERNDQLEQEVAERERLISDLDSFAHTVAHDIKGPVTSLQMSISLFIDETRPRLTEEDLEVLDMCYRSASRMTAIINELLLLATLRDEDLQIEELDMQAIVEQAMERMDPELVELDPIVFEPKEWYAATGRAVWVEEVWYNLLSNALKYGGRPPQITLGNGPAEEGRVRYWVRDNGEGVTEEVRRLLLEGTGKVHRDRAKGHGLGLSVVRRVIERLGGVVDCYSEPGKGATFFFELPGVPDEQGEQ